MSHGVDRPGIARLHLQGAQTAGLGLRVAAALLLAEGAHAVEIGVARHVLAPGRQNGGDPVAEHVALAKQEVGQVCRLDGDQIVR